MSIIYALIARQDENILDSESNANVLVEVNEDSTGSYSQIIREVILNHLPKEPRAIINYKERYNFHILNIFGFVYICMTDESYSKRRAQSFLIEIEQLFCNKFTLEQRQKAITFSLNKS